MGKSFAKTTLDNKLNRNSVVSEAPARSKHGLQNYNSAELKKNADALPDGTAEECLQPQIEPKPRIALPLSSFLVSQTESKGLAFQEEAKKSHCLASLPQKPLQEFRKVNSNKLGKKNIAETPVSDPSNDSCKTDSKSPPEKTSEMSPTSKQKGPVSSPGYAELTSPLSFEKSFNWRQSNNTIRKRPEYSELAQKLEEQFKSGGSLTRSQVFGMQTHTAKAKTEDSASEEQSEDLIHQEQTAVEESTRAPAVKPDIIRASVPNMTTESPLQPVKKQLLMELTERLAKRSGSTTTDENSWLTEPEPQRSMLRPQAIERLESELSPHEQCPTKFRSDLPNKARPWSPPSFPPASSPPTPSPPPPPPPLLPTTTTTAAETTTTTRPPLPPPLHLLLSKFCKADERLCAPWQPASPVVRPSETYQIQTKDENVDGHEGDENVDGAEQQQLEKREELKPSHISFPPNDKLITTHAYVTTTVTTPKDAESKGIMNDLGAMENAGLIQLHTGSGDETSDTGCSTESLRKSVLDRKRKLFPRPQLGTPNTLQKIIYTVFVILSHNYKMLLQITVSHTVPDLKSVHTQLAEFISEEANEQPRHFTRWRPHDFGQENGNSQFERPQSAPAVAQNSINLTIPPPPPLPLPPNPPQIPKRPQIEKPWKPYPVYLF
ncbi:uncharacterized protein DEA37_0012205 [Paragonimus westermani]|uniref:Uncharacterized protein n=1 Tax=Paragonimus westermani TaxID=34504 RepID=A0A5J4NDI7_9TREM|nr:uncharacterized protein DEA37_0012205 [Paragonimus westermani]